MNGRTGYLPPEHVFAAVCAALFVVSAGVLVAVRWFDRQVDDAVTFRSVDR